MKKNTENRLHERMFHLIEEKISNSNIDAELIKKIKDFKKTLSGKEIEDMEKLANELGYFFHVELEPKSIYPQALTYPRISKALAKDYFSIYYVNIETGEYIEYSSGPKCCELKIEHSGTDFFGACMQKIQQVIYEEDRERLTEVFSKDNLLNEIKKDGIFSISYRILMDGKPIYVNAKIISYDENNNYIIIGVRNIDIQKRREIKYEQALGNIMEMANKDALTGVKNKLAYNEAELDIDRRIEKGENVEFGIVVCDVNGLKDINDSKGHKAGDALLKEACMKICNIFKHSPVYRIGGDEFAVLLIGHDLKEMEKLMEIFDKENRAGQTPEDIVIACGAAVYDPKTDKDAAAVFERADFRMYENKKDLKKDQNCK